MAYKCLEGVEVLCSKCNKPAQVHHIVKRGKAPFLEECIYNMAFLCEYHHTSSKGVEHNREFDLELKREMQQKLEVLFSNDYYTREEIKEILVIKNKDVDQLCKLITWNEKGYKSKDIIWRCMGRRNYL